MTKTKTTKKNLEVLRLRLYFPVGDVEGDADAGARGLAGTRRKWVAVEASSKTTRTAGCAPLSAAGLPEEK